MKSKRFFLVAHMQLMFLAEFEGFFDGVDVGLLDEFDSHPAKLFGYWYLTTQVDEECEFWEALQGRVWTSKKILKDWRHKQFHMNLLGYIKLDWLDYHARRVWKALAIPQIGLANLTTHQKSVSQICINRPVFCKVEFHSGKLT